MNLSSAYYSTQEKMSIHTKLQFLIAKHGWSLRSSTYTNLRLRLIWFTASRSPIIIFVIIIVNQAPILPWDWARTMTLAVFFRGTPISLVLSISFMIWALAPFPGAVLRAIGVPPNSRGRTTCLLWASFVESWTMLPASGWQRRTPVGLRTPRSSIIALDTSSSLHRCSRSTAEGQDSAQQSVLTKPKPFCRLNLPWLLLLAWEL